MAAATLSSMDWLYKRLYAKGLDEDALISANSLLKWVSRDKKFASSQGKVIPAPYVNPQGIAATHATANTNTSASKGVAFLVPQRKQVMRIDLDGDVVQNAINGGDEAQFVNTFTREIDGGTEAFGQELNQRLYGDVLGGRALVHASTAPSTTTLTLANPQDAQFFEVGMKVAAYDTATGTLRNSGATAEIAAVDPVLGTLTATGNWTTAIAALAVGDTLVRGSMHNASLDGLKGWVPATVSGSDSFMGVNRSVYRTRLAGVYYDASGSSVRAGFLKAFGFARQQIGGKFSTKAPIFMHPDNVIQLIQTVEAVKVVDTSLETEYNVGLEAIEILGNNIVQDRHCPVNEAFMIPKGAFTLGTSGNAPELEDKGGSRFFHDPDSGTVKSSILMLGNGYSEAVNSILRIKLPSVG